MTDTTAQGLSGGLTNYGDRDFALYLRRLILRQPLPGYRLFREVEDRRELLHIRPANAPARACGKDVKGVCTPHAPAICTPHAAVAAKLLARRRKSTP